MKIRRALILLASALAAAHALPAAAQTIQKVSMVSDSASYRSGAARHIYATYAERIYKGILPPLVHAVVVLETEVDALGNVKAIRVIRSPSHAPDVTEVVKGMIQRASPFPAPGSAGGAKFTEVWLVDHSGRFQLHALTEGQH
jgi:hypothetical protein